ncbi:MAG: toxin-antitoxin system HicB family antitoxin [Chitinophagia bacterium]|nr:toxin-antitoxin system HicB family antitoxin [Chitinophagia bacterium]
MTKQVHIPVALHRAAKAAAAREGISLQQLAEKAVAEYLAMQSQAA